MKRNYFFVLIASLILLISCGKSNTASSDNLVGVYKDDMGSILELKKDGTAIQKSDLAELHKTWSVKGDTFCLAEKRQEICGKYTFIGNTLTWYPITLGIQEMTLTYTKIKGATSNSANNRINGLVDKWVLKSINGNESQKEVLKLNDDGTLHIKTDNGEMAGIWTFCDDLLNTVILSGSGAECNEFYSIEGSFTLNDDTLIWNTIIEGEKQTHTYKRD